uniref:Protein BLISTER n=1 Tax=Rhizophora mucronata TaxID=61149 RepID=A0A2P2MC61_RHIMU
MATAPVLPSSRKQEHLEAGKRRLEEFRKKKAAERAKKAAGSSQPHASNVVQDLTQPLETEHVRHADSDVAGTSGRPNGTIETFSVSIDNKNNIMDVVQKAEQGSLNDEDDNFLPISDYDRTAADLVHRQTNNIDLKRHDASKFLGPGDINYGQETNEMDNNSFKQAGSQGGPSYQNLANHSVASQPQVSQQFESSPNQSSLYGMVSFLPKGTYSLKNSADSHISTSPPNYTISQLQAEPSSINVLSPHVDSQHPIINSSRSSQVEQDMHAGTEFNGLMNPNSRERNSSSFLSVPAASVQGTENRGFNSDSGSSSNHVPRYLATSESSSRRSRPSFLDSLNVSGTSTGPSFLHTEPEKELNVPNSLTSNGVDFLGSLAFQKPSIDNGPLGPFLMSQPPGAPVAIEHSMDYVVSSNNAIDQFKSNVIEDNMESKHGFYSAKQNEDFAALEQHIEDLTQEKFSLQRALEASRTLSASLAAENSSLTDSYNQQTSVVDQLKSDTGKLQEEIKAYLAELESVRIEYANAQLECNAADERAKLLASEVIGLEEKVANLLHALGFVSSSLSLFSHLAFQLSSLVCLVFCILHLLFHPSHVSAFKDSIESNVKILNTT